jgi:hypothetical protein
MSDIGAADDKRIQAIPFDFLKGSHIYQRGQVSSFQARYGKRMDVELNDLITRSHQSKKLSFCRFQCGIGHHIEQTDMHFPDVLLTGAIWRQYFFTFFT